MDLQCVQCEARYYTAARFVRNLECSECGGRLVPVPDRDRALISADDAAPAQRAPSENAAPVPSR